MASLFVNAICTLLALNATPGIGTKRFESLLARFGSLEEIRASSPQEWGWGARIAEEWVRTCREAKGEREWEMAKKWGIQIILCTDSLYPPSLRLLPDYPLVLYVQGKLPEHLARSVGIVGTRTASSYGREMAYLFAKEIAGHARPIISGLARGIDTAAHEGALQTGETVAVLGSGLLSLYPKENEGLSLRIAERGAVVSEYPLQTSPTRYTFPRRNRLISAMSRALFLVEAPNKSGAMLTVEYARQQQLPIFVLPGRVDVESFQGNHTLIREGATLVSSPKELLRSLKDSIEDLIPEGEVNLKKCLDLSVKEQEILCLFTDREENFEKLAFQFSGNVATLGALLTSLVLKGVVQEYPGKIYKKLF